MRGENLEITKIFRVNPITVLPDSTYEDSTEIVADQLYSNSGRSTLFDINTAYNSCDDVGTYLNRFEITGITEAVNDPDCSGSIPLGGVCITVPAYSSGYFTIPMDVYIQRLGENSNVFSLFPNPAATKFKLKSNFGIELTQELNVTILDITGKPLLQMVYENEESVDISTLPSGIYLVTITNQDNETETKKLIKIK